MGILDLLLPRETKFFNYLAEQVDHLKNASITFQQILQGITTISEENLKAELLKIKDYERQGDKVEGIIIDELNKTFITPFDREDIHTLTMNIDRALDVLNSIARKIEIYHIRQIPQNALTFIDIIVKISEELEKLMVNFKNSADIQAIVTKMHQLEHDADELFHASVADLFSDKYSPVEIIKLKELFEHLEAVVDAVDYAGKLVRGIKLKQG